MQTLNSHENKLKELTNETKVKFNVAMHGMVKGRVLKYGSADRKLQTLIRRRLIDASKKKGDKSIEIVTADTSATVNTSVPSVTTRIPSASSSKASNTGDK